SVGRAHGNSAGAGAAGAAVFWKPFLRHAASFFALRLLPPMRPPFDPASAAVMRGMVPSLFVAYCFSAFAVAAWCYGSAPGSISALFSSFLLLFYRALVLLS